jgi:hypothetical protein
MAYGVDSQRMLPAIGKLYDLKVVRHEGEYPIITATGDIRSWATLYQSYRTVAAWC